MKSRKIFIEMTIFVVFLLALAIVATMTLPLAQFPIVIISWILVAVSFGHLVHMAFN